MKKSYEEKAIMILHSWEIFFEDCALFALVLVSTTYYT